MQFEDATFSAYAVHADKRHRLSPYDPADAIYPAAKMLCADGAYGGSLNGIMQAVYAYNHAWWYVNDVMSMAERYSGPLPRPVAHPVPTVQPGPTPGIPGQRNPAGPSATCSPDRIRTGVTALRGRRPRPLDDGAVPCPGNPSPGCKPAISSGVQTTASPTAEPTGGSNTPNAGSSASAGAGGSAGAGASPGSVASLGPVGSVGLPGPVGPSGTVGASPSGTVSGGAAASASPGSAASASPGSADSASPAGRRRPWRALAGRPVPALAGRQARRPALSRRPAAARALSRPRALSRRPARRRQRRAPRWKWQASRRRAPPCPPARP